ILPDTCSDVLDNEIDYRDTNILGLDYTGATNASIILDGSDCGDSDCEGIISDIGSDGVPDGICNYSTGQVAIESNCTDNIDNNLDGLTDCEDSDCQGTSTCPSNPSNSIVSRNCSETDCSAETEINAVTETLPFYTYESNFNSKTVDINYTNYQYKGRNLTFHFSDISDNVGGEQIKIFFGTTGDTLFPYEINASGSTVWVQGDYADNFSKTFYSYGAQEENDSIVLEYLDGGANLYPNDDLNLTVVIGISDSALVAQNSPYEFTLSVVEGSVEAKDNTTINTIENENPSKPFIVRTDNNLSLQLIRFNNYSYRLSEDDTITVKVNASDDGTFNSGIEYCEFNNGSGWIVESGVYDCIHDMSLQEGSNTIQIRAVDGVGNVGESTSMNLNVVTLPRQISGMYCSGSNCTDTFPAKTRISPNELLNVGVNFTSDVAGFTSSGTGCNVTLENDTNIINLGTAPLTAYNSGKSAKCVGEFTLSTISNGYYKVAVEVIDDNGNSAVAGELPNKDGNDKEGFFVCPYITLPNGERTCAYESEIPEAAPTMTDVIINSTTGTNRSSDNLTCYAQATDTDGDNITFDGSWYKNGVENSSFNLSPINFSSGDVVNVSVISNERTFVGENWSCKVRAYDWMNYSSYKSSNNLTILDNNPPIMDSVFVNSSLGNNYTDEDLNCYAKATDLNGDNLSYEGDWYKDGELFVGLIKNITDTGESTLSTSARDIDFDSSGNIYVGGLELGATDNFFTAKFNSSGSMIWNRTFDYNESNEQAEGIAVDSNGNVYVVGDFNDGSDHDILIVKYNSTGDYQWNRTFDTDNDTEAYDVDVDSNGNLYTVGYFERISSNHDWLILKYNSSGNQVWNETIYDSGYDEQAHAVEIDSSNESYFYVTGYAEFTSTGVYYFRTIKFNSSAGIEWIGNHDPIPGGTVQAKAVRVADASGNVYVSGAVYNTTGGGSNYDFYALKYNSTGDYQWNVSRDLGGDSIDIIEGMDIDNIGNLYIGGYKRFVSAYVLKYNLEGDYIWNNTDSNLGNAVSDLRYNKDTNKFYIAGGNFFTYLDAVVEEYKDGFATESKEQGEEALVDVLDYEATSAEDNWSCRVRAKDNESYSNYLFSSNLTVNLKKDNGEQCASGDECQSGNCVEGVCCDTACSGGCYSCLASRTGGSDGTCSAVIDNTDPLDACFEGNYVCSGSGSPNSCSRTFDSGLCVSGACESGGGSDNAPLGDVCDSGNYIDATTLAYAATDTSCNSSVPTNGFGDITDYYYACDGTGGISSTAFTSEVNTDCGTGCCYESGGPICVDSGNHSTINFYDFGSSNGFGDNGATDYCISNEVKDCYSDVDCLDDYYCTSSNECREKPNVSLIYPEDGAIFNNDDEIQFNYSVIHGYSGIPANCSLYGDFNGTWQRNQTMYTGLDNDTETAFPSKLTLSIGSYIWNVHCHGSDDWGDNNRTLDVEEENKPTWNNNNTNAVNGTTKYNETVWFSINWSDDTGMNRSIFSWNMTGSGSFTNETTYDCENNLTCLHNQSLTITGTRGDEFCWKFYGYDKFDNLNETGLWCFTIGNTLPTVELISPADRASVTDRTPTLVWNGTDVDGDSLSYELNLTLVPSSLCTDTGLNQSGLSNENYTTPVLNCLYDNGDYYEWSVRANDSVGSYGNWSSIRIFNISSQILINLTTDSVNFGQIDNNDTNDTTDDNPGPFVLQNDGNCIVNLTINATQLFDEAASSSDYYKYKIDNKTGEEGSFDSLASIISWTQMPVNTAEVLAIAELNWSNSTDVAETDLYVEVPSSESAGTKSTTVYFSSSLAE
ncbi:hypothetical protein GF378_02365, partial [Candidatus Pacearchaeota archaeon]|nr:hypothetical protein [Candidatus Pacearchaeota archaeon]